MQTFACKKHQWFSETEDCPECSVPVEAVVHTDQAIEAAVLAFCQAMRELELAIREQFPIGSKVAVKLDSVTAIAVVHAYVAGFPDRLALLFENGNVWDKAVTRISRLV